uniref:Small G protein signaling modulator 1a n=1 Tax=Scophthalmus maximus TaxID=52904 RepID=A0A8D3DVQ8_SCOMX
IVESLISAGNKSSLLDCVKQIMEEAVTRKFVHEDSSHIVSFCAAVEACVLHGLRRRAAGFLRSNKIAALFMKVGKSFAPAEELCRKAQELEQIIETKRSQSLQSQDSLRKMPRLPSLTPQGGKNLWIRTALFEKVLDKIVLYLVENSSKYYEKEAVLMDPVDGPILASLLVGPCALEYTKMKTADHFWTDPSADELVQRHRIHGGHCRQDSPTKRPALCIQKRHSSSSMDERPSPSPSAREYVESLHQNSRATLLFGKNNVLVQPRDDMEAIPGYLSLHQTADVMTLKWTPNQLMNGSVGDLDYECSVYWDYAMTIPLGEIVYLHCHQQVDSGGTVVLVSQDGIQRPPLRFPRGGHLLQFLSCLENGLLPHGQLDPPLWSQRGKGKVFPKLRNRVPQGSGSSDSVSDKEEDEATDYVFRILFPNSQSEFVIPPDLMDQGATMWHPTLRKTSCSSCSQGSFSDGATPKGCNQERAPLKLLCDSMKYQIISRAFYGWLAYCRHLSTVRTHLSALVNHTIVAPGVPSDAYKGLTPEVWQTFLQDCTAYKEQELLRLVYFGGVEPSLRKEVWPFLLGHYQFGMSEAQRKEVDERVRVCYQQTMREWLGCEEIVRQREKEQHAAALAKCSSGASMDGSSLKMIHRDSTVSNESSQSSERQSLALLQSDSSSSTQVFESIEEVDQIEMEPKTEEAKQVPKMPNGALQNGTCSPDSGHPSSRNFSVTSGLSDGSLSTEDTVAPDTTLRSAAVLSVKPAGGESEGLTEEMHNIKQIKSLESGETEIGMSAAAESKGELVEQNPGKPSPEGTESILSEEPEMECLYPHFDSLARSGDTKNGATSGESAGSTFSQELLDLYTLNLHRIEKDVQRCDRNYWYFSPANLEKLRNIMCRGVFPLTSSLCFLLPEAMAFSCFTELMKRMNQNFPHGGAMDTHFANMRSLIQILDSELFELMHQNGDYTHFYFCYRWFLLDFKRELVYEDVFAVWETIWAAKYVSSSHFVLFIALALVEIYRDIILENNMDFTDIIKFFNEMAEHHNIKQILPLARDLVCKVQMLIENK